MNNQVKQVEFNLTEALADAFVKTYENQMKKHTEMACSYIDQHKYGKAFGEVIKAIRLSRNVDRLYKDVKRLAK